MSPDAIPHPCSPRWNAPSPPNAAAHARPVAHPADKIEYARLLKGEGATLGQIAAKTGILMTSVHRYLDPTPARHDDPP
ncbi:MAG: hypothetical protein ACRDTX_06465 [Pseudonocardiaceae bacterium]